MPADKTGRKSRDAAPTAGPKTRPGAPIVAEPGAAAGSETAEIPLIADPGARTPVRRTGGIVHPTNAAGTPRPPVYNPPRVAARNATPPPGAPIILPPSDRDVMIDPTPIGVAMAPSTRAMLQRRRVAMLVAFVVIAVIVLVVGQMVNRGNDSRIRTVSPVASALPPAAGIGEPTGTEATSGGTSTPKTTAGAPGAATTKATDQPPADTADNSPTKPAGTAGVFNFAMGYGPVLGTAGTLRRFKVSVEKSLGQGNGGDFADEIDRTLGDPRSWVAGRQFRLQRVPQSAASEFTIYLASAKTSEKMCAAGGLSTDGFTSCRLPGQVIINQDRWQDAVPDYGAPLEVYRAYAINHEVGHQLGHGHEACSGKGRAAPVMMQQTYGLKGCVANSWPYIDGKRYAGASLD